MEISTNSTDVAMEAMDLFAETPEGSSPSGYPPLRSQAGSTAQSDVPVAKLLLEVDQIYRKRAGQDSLPKIAPKQLNRSGVAWLPVMQLYRQGWHFKVRFSNTLQANRLGKTSDWVILNYQSDTGASGRVTVVTETRGSDKGKRSLRGYQPQSV